MLKETIILLTVCALQSCQQANISTTSITKNDVNENINSFKAKTIDSDDLSIGYMGFWDHNSVSKEPLWTAEPLSPKNNSKFGDVEGSYMAGTKLENTGLVSLDWIKDTLSNSYKTNGNISETHQQSSSSIVYSDTFFSGSASGLGYIIPNQNISYNGTGWLTKNGYKYNYNRSKNASVEFNITGTNVEIHGMKGANPGWNNLKITVKDSNGNTEQVTGFDANNNQIPDLSNISTLSTQNELGKIFKIKGLNHGVHTIKIESSINSRSTGQPTFMISFDRAIVYPSIQFNFSKPNIAYKANKDSNSGIVDVTVKEGNTILDSQEKDLYSSSSNSSFVYTKSFNDSNPKTITIEATGKSNTSSLNKNINISSFGFFPVISGTFNGDKLITKFKKSTLSNKVSIYVDGLYKDDLDLLNSTLPDSYSFLNVGGLETTNHTFQIISDYSKNGSAIPSELKEYSGIQKAKIRVKTTTGGQIEFNSRKGSDKGKAKITFKDVNSTALPVPYSANLYSSGPASFFQLYPINAGEYIITIEPDYTKDSLSTGYMVEFNNVKFYSSNPQTALSGRATIDTVCNP